MNSLDQIAYDLVTQLNQELYNRFENTKEFPQFVFTTNGYVSAIQWGEWCVWDSENVSLEDEEGNEIPLETYVRSELDQLATAAEWIARDYAHEKVSLAHCLFFLNGLVEIDHDAMKALVETRVPCSTKLADHPTVQVQLKDRDSKDAGQTPEAKREWTVGLLGILNGLFGAFQDGGPKHRWGQIAAVFKKDGRLSCFRRSFSPDIVPSGENDE